MQNHDITEECERSYRVENFKISRPGKITEQNFPNFYQISLNIVPKGLVDYE